MGKKESKEHHFSDELLDKVYKDLDSYLKFLQGKPREIGKTLENLESRMLKVSPDYTSWESKQGYNENLEDLKTHFASCLALERIDKKANFIRNTLLNEKSEKVSPVKIWGYLIATREEVQRQVKDIRLQYWGSTDAPIRHTNFNNAKDALNASFALLEETVENDIQELENRNHSGVTLGIDISFEIDNFDIEALDSLLENIKSVHETQDLEDLSRRLKQHARMYSGVIKNIGSNIYGKSETVSVIGDDGWAKTVKAPYLGRVADLWRQVKSLSASVEHWSDSSTLTYILTDLVPDVEMGWNLKIDDSYSLSYSAPGPFTEEELLESYKAIMKQYRIKALPLSRTQQAVIALNLLEPEKTWTQRLERWSEWCAQDVTLTRFEGSRASEMLSQEYKRALKRVRWQRVPLKSATTVPQPHPNTLE